MQHLNSSRFIALTTAILFCANNIASAQTAATTAVETFDAAAVPAYFTNVTGAGTWSVVNDGTGNNVLQGAGGGANPPSAYALLKDSRIDSLASAFEVSAYLKPFAGTGNVSAIAFNLMDAQNYYEAGIYGDGLLLRVRKVIPGGVPGGDSFLLSSYTDTTVKEGFVKVVKNANNIKVFLNGVLRIDFNDTTTSAAGTPPLIGGTTGLLSAVGTGQFDNYSVVKIFPVAITILKSTDPGFPSPVIPTNWAIHTSQGFHSGFTTDTFRIIDLTPGIYEYFFLTSAVQTGSSFTFTVDFNGMVSSSACSSLTPYATCGQGFLTVHPGIKVTVTRNFSSNLVTPNWRVDNIFPFTTATSQSFSMIPGTYSFTGSIGTPFLFTVNPDGTIGSSACSSPTPFATCGQGSLIVNGFPLVVNNNLTGSWRVDNVFPFSTKSSDTVSGLIPGGFPYTFTTGALESFSFTIGADGKIQGAPATFLVSGVSQPVSGNGTGTLTVGATACTITADAGADTTVSNGVSVTLMASATGGTSPYSFLWSNGANTASTNVVPAATTSFTVTITDNNGCTSVDSVTINLLTLNITVMGKNCNNPFSVTQQSSCNGSEFQFGNNQNDLWLSFTATDSIAQINVYPPSSGITAQITKVTAYSGTCNNLDTVSTNTSFNGDTLQAIAAALSPGQSYLFKVERTQSTINGVGICVNQLLFGSGFKHLATIEGCGLNYAYSALKLNKRVESNTTPGTPLPASFSVNVPAGSTKVKAYLWFTAITSMNPQPQNSSNKVSLTFSNTTVDATLLGSTQFSTGICWSYLGSPYQTLKFTASYFCDVTSLVPSSISGTNTFQINDFLMGNTPMDISFMDLNGAALLIAYKEPTPPCSGFGSNKISKLVLWHGLDVQTGGNAGEIEPYLMGTTTTGGPLNSYNEHSPVESAFMIVADIQNTNTQYNMNGSASAPIGGSMYSFVKQNTVFTSNQQTALYNIIKDGSDCFALSVMGAYLISRSDCKSDFSVAISGNNLLCSSSGNSTVTLDAVVSGNGGTTPYAYLWSTGGTGSSVTVGPASPFTAYAVTVTATNGCTATAEFIVEVKNAPVVKITGNDNLCFGSTTFLIANVSAGTSPFTYQWSTGQTTPFAIVNTTNLGVGTTDVKVTVTDAGGCNGFDSKPIVVKPTPIAPQIGSSEFPIKCPGNDILYFVLNPQAGATYTWTTSDQGTIVGANPGTQVSAFWPASINVSTGTLTVTASFANGCTSSATVVVAACCNSAFNLGNTVQVLNNKTVSSGFGSSNGVSGVNIEINGTLTVDKSFSFNNCVINMGENAQIVIPSSVNSTMLDIFCTSIFAQNCQDRKMWDGIYVNAPASATAPNNQLLMNATAPGDCGNLTLPIVAHAKNAVVSVNGGHFTLKNYDYRDNYTGLDVRPFPGNHTGTVNGCFFRHVNGLINPLTGTNASFGIIMKKIGNISIGSTTGGGSDFISIDSVGIHCEKSNATILKNKFDLITAFAPMGTPPPPLPEKACIRVIGEFVPKPQPGQTFNTVIIGNIKGANSFKHSSMGVLIYDNVNVAVQNNTFQDMNGVLATGVKAVGCRIGKLNISKNKFTGFKTGVYLLQSGDDVQIISNQFTNLSPLLSTGILLENAVLVSKITFALIEANSITNVLKGIHLKNYKSLNLVKVVNNEIVYTGSTASAVRTGIHIENSKSNCNENRISNNGQTPTSPGNTTGIHLQISPSSLVTNNVMSKMSQGIFCQSNSNFTPVRCNTMSWCFRGIVLSGSTLGDQGDDLNTQDNQWFNTPSDATGVRIRGDNNTQEKWFYRTGTALQGHFNVNPFDPQTAIFPEPVSTLSNFFCTVGCLSCKQNALAKAINNPSQPSVLVEENKFLEKEHILAELRSDAALMQQGTADDAVLQAFHDSMMQTNSGKIREVQELASAEEIDSARQKNMLISPDNILEENYKTVHTVFLNSWAAGRYKLDSAETATVETVALQNSFTGGRAVHHARAMLGIDIADELPVNPSPRLTAPTTKKEEEVHKPALNHVTSLTVSRLYPNPNNGNMMLDYSFPNGQTGEIYIFDLFGKIMLRQKLTSDKRVIQLNEDKLLPGIYHYSISVDGVVHITDKLVIIK